MFSLYKFIFQRLIWKAISVYILWFDYCILKEWKTAKVHNLSVSGSNYLHKWLVHFLTCLLVPCLFFLLQKFQHLCNPRTGWPTLISILWKWASKLTGLAGHGECRLDRFHPIKNFLSNGTNSCSIKQATFLLGKPTPYNQLLIHLFFLIPECYFK